MKQSENGLNPLLPLATSVGVQNQSILSQPRHIHILRGCLASSNWCIKVEL